MLGALTRRVSVQAVIAALFLSAAATSAGAATAPHEERGAALAATCNRGEFCFWEFPNRQGQIFRLRTQDSTFTNNACPGCTGGGSWNDKASSAQNLRSETVCLWVNVNFSGGQVVRLGPNQTANQLNPDNAASSGGPCA